MCMDAVLVLVYSLLNLKNSLEYFYYNILMQNTQVVAKSCKLKHYNNVS